MHANDDTPDILALNRKFKACRFADINRYPFGNTIHLRA